VKCGKALPQGTAAGHYRWMPQNAARNITKGPAYRCTASSCQQHDLFIVCHRWQRRVEWL